MIEIEKVFYEGLDYYNKGRYEQAYPLFLRAAFWGYEPAQTYVGKMYQLGQGVAKDLLKAKEWYQKAAEHGDAEAKRMLDAMQKEQRKEEMVDAPVQKKEETPVKKKENSQEKKTTFAIKTTETKRTQAVKPRKISVKKTEEPPQRTERKKESSVRKAKTSPMDELQAMVGLDGVKKDVQNTIQYARVQKLREQKGMKIVPTSRHLVFTGNPGTGKTTVARILAETYREIGVLSKGHLVEVDRASLVARYVGQTAIKTKEKVQSAFGGVLFIDEAYTLNKGNNDFGQEAIDTILKMMEDQRDDLIVIVAGYPHLMEEFLDSNPGLQSRFKKQFHFPDYSGEEMYGIFLGLCAKYGYELVGGADQLVKEHILQMEADRTEHFGNAREVRNLFERVLENQAERIGELEEIREIDLVSITGSDIVAYEKRSRDKKNKIGFR